MHGTAEPPASVGSGTWGPRQTSTQPLPGLPTVLILRAEQHDLPLNDTKEGRESLPFCPNSVNFINKDDGWCVFFSNSKQFPNEFGAIAQVLLNKFRANHSQESG